MKNIALVIIGMVPVLLLLGSPPDPGLLGLTLLVAVYLTKNRLKEMVKSIKIRPEIKYVLAAAIMAVIVELVSWLGTFWANEMVEGTPLFSLSLGTDLLLSFGLYLALILSWVTILSIYKFNLKQVLIVMGLVGLLVEQQGQVIMSVVANPVAIIMAGYTFLVYAPLAALPFLLVEEELETTRNSWVKYPLLIVLMVVMILTVGVGWNWLAEKII